MAKYKYVNDFSGPDGRVMAGTEVELDPGHRLVVDGFVTLVPVVTDWERNEKAIDPVPEYKAPTPASGSDWHRNEAASRPTDAPAPEVTEVDDLPEDASEDEVEDKVKRVIHRNKKS